MNKALGLIGLVLVRLQVVPLEIIEGCHHQLGFFMTTETIIKDEIE